MDTKINVYILSIFQKIA